jgi:hypothetical protein
MANIIKKILLQKGKLKIEPFKFKNEVSITLRTYFQFCPPKCMNMITFPWSKMSELDLKQIFMIKKVVWGWNETIRTFW